jgi:hypothetical protein
METTTEELVTTTELEITTTTTTTTMVTTTTTPVLIDFFQDSESTTTSTQTTTIKSPQTKQNERINLLLGPFSGDEIDFEVNSNQYQEIVVEKSREEEENGVQVYSIRSPTAALSKYQIQLHISTESHLDFDKCVIAYSLDPKQETTLECLHTYIQVFDAAHIKLKINRKLLPNQITLKLRHVISGCDETTRFKDLMLTTSLASLPIIYHNSDHECIYRYMTWICICVVNHQKN